MRATTYLFFLSASLSFAQVPQIASNGVLNSASWGITMAPGSLVSIFGSNLATTTQSANPPLPFTLGGTSVTINGIPAPLFFVSSGQINLQLPSAVTAPSLADLNGTFLNLGTATAVVTAPGGVSSPASFYVLAASPSFFTTDGSGCGAASALNITPDGTISINSPSNSAAPGDYIALFGTGFGPAGAQPADGVAAAGAAPLQSAPVLLVDYSLAPAPQYAGLAPSTVGVDQINFQLPATTRNGCNVPVFATQILDTPTVTISVQTGRGQCIDPPIQSYGEISLYKSFFYVSGSPLIESDSISAEFFSGPLAHPPALPSVIFAPEWVGGLVAPVSVGNFLFLLIPGFTCPVPDYIQLSAGAIQVQAADGSSATVSPFPLPVGAVYSQSFPDGFIGPGTYTISGTQGNPVTLQASVEVGSPIQIQTPLSPGTTISSSQPLTIKWTGGDPGSLVRVSLYSGRQYLYTYANAADGSLTIAPSCTGIPAVCTFGLAPSTSAQLEIDVSPSPTNVATASAAGITGQVQISWTYSYTFTGLMIAP